MHNSTNIQNAFWVLVRTKIEYIIWIFFLLTLNVLRLQCTYRQLENKVIAFAWVERQSYVITSRKLTPEIKRIEYPLVFEQSCSTNEFRLSIGSCVVYVTYVPAPCVCFNAAIRCRCFSALSVLFARQFYALSPI